MGSEGSGGGGQSRRWSWSSALIGAAAATATAALLSSKPRDPAFHLVSIDLTSFKPNFPVMDADVILTVHVSNPNVAPIQYSPTEMSIFYAGSLLGSAHVKAGSQPPRSCQLLRLPARLKGNQLAKHSKKFVEDVGRREMVLDAAVDIEGAAKVLWRDQRFRVHVDSHVKVDPVFLDVVDQENKSKLKICLF
nr:late embryogenesis abundant hydroxyproline-rich glycoprotein [Ipomoea batatas]